MIVSEDSGGSENKLKERERLEAGLKYLVLDKGLEIGLFTFGSVIKIILSPVIINFTIKREK